MSVPDGCGGGSEVFVTVDGGVEGVNVIDDVEVNRSEWLLLDSAEGSSTRDEVFDVD